jgi:hypothetical protein
LKRWFIIAVVLFAFETGCKESSNQLLLEQFSAGQLQSYNRKLTQVIITDIFTPPVCSRIYAYANIAAYEATRPGYQQYPSFAGKLKGLQTLPLPDSNKDYNYPVSGIIAFLTVAQKLVFNKEAIANIENDYLRDLRNVSANQKMIQHSIDYGRKVGNHIIDWAGEDGYLQRTSLPAYIVTKELGRWQPTPPDYMDAIEPNWKTIRPFVLDSAAQFRPPAPTAFDTTKNSPFFKEAMEVYQAVRSITTEKTAIAKFWDCNPNISVTQGHVTYFQQKISPGGHWLHVAASVTQQKNFDAMKTAEVLSKVSITIADAFISCWEGKYRYTLIRPETYLNRYVDKDWKPLLQTPGFPEYTSGHSVASSSAAVMLTALIGDNYSYKDSTELPFGLPVREYRSFTEAAEEACISRLYGGIHFMPAIKNGAEQGKKIGNLMVSRLN